MAGSVLLIVVDNPAHRVLFNRHLGATAHHLVFARDGEDGFDRFAEVKPDLVIAHVNAARLDGTILCQLIRQQPRGEAVPFVLLGEEFARAEAGRERIATVGADAFLPVPFDRRTLIERITPLLTFGRQEQSSRKIEAIPAAEIVRRSTAEMVAPQLERSAKAAHHSDQVLEFSAVVQAIEGAVEVDEDGDGVAPARQDTDGGAWGGAAENLLAEPEAPVPMRSGSALADAADTVVSFQNPYAEVGINQRPVIAVEDVSVVPKGRALEHEAVTHIEMLDRPNAALDARVTEPQKVRLPGDPTQPIRGGHLENDEATFDEAVAAASKPRAASASRTEGRIEVRAERSDTPRIEVRAEIRGESRAERAAGERGEARGGAEQRVPGERDVRDARGESRDARGDVRDARGDVRDARADARDARGDARDARDARGESRDVRDARGEVRDARGDVRDARDRAERDRGEMRSGEYRAADTRAADRGEMRSGEYRSADARTAERGDAREVRGASEREGRGHAEARGLAETRGVAEARGEARGVGEREGRGVAEARSVGEREGRGLAEARGVGEREGRGLVEGRGEARGAGELRAERLDVRGAAADARVERAESRVERGDGRGTGEGRGGDGRIVGEGRAGDGRSGDGRVIGEGRGEGRSVEGRGGDGRSVEGRGGEGRSADGRSDGRGGDGRAEGRIAEGRIAEGRIADGRSAEGRSAEGRSSERPMIDRPEILRAEPRAESRTEARSELLRFDRNELRNGTFDDEEDREPILDEPPILDRPQRDPLEEPPISGVAPPVPDHSDSSQKARLIAEPPRELTPSSSDRGRSPLREAVPAAVRRGLDESQLGKRLAKRVRTMHRLLDEVDYYQILGVDPEADAEVLKRAYFDLSLEFHPDRFFLLRSGDLKEKIYAIYRRVTEAYSVLSDERRRRAYEEGRIGKHEKRAPPELREEDLHPIPQDRTDELSDISAANSKAKRMLDLARSALAGGDVNGARLHLHLALAYEQENAKLRTAIDRIAELARPT